MRTWRINALAPAVCAKRNNGTYLKRAAQLVIPDDICLAEGAREQGSFWGGAHLGGISVFYVIHDGTWVVDLVKGSSCATVHGHKSANGHSVLAETG